MVDRPFSGIVGVETIIGGCAKTAQNISCLYFSKVDDDGKGKADVQCG